MSLTARFSLVLCAVVLLTAICSAGLIFWRLNEQLVEAEVGELERVTEVRAQILRAHISSLLSDVKAAAGMPPTQGILRAEQNNGVDPLDGSTTEDWKRRLNGVYQNMLASKNDYVQIRFITAARNGQEIVRVDRSRPGADVRVVTGDDLQSKAHTDYFQAVRLLAPGQIHLSAINLNREHGSIQQPQLPVIRASVPLHDANGKFFGAVVINSGLTLLFDALTESEGRGQQFYLINGEGSYLRHPDPSYQFDFEFDKSHRAQTDFPIFSILNLGPSDEVASLANRSLRRVVSLRWVNYGGENSDSRVGIVVTEGFEAIRSTANELLRDSILVLILLLVLALLLGIWISRQAAMPYTRLAAAVDDMDVENTRWDRPQRLTGEAGELASALDSAFSALERQSTEIQKKNRDLRQFNYISSHDLQEPVRTVTTYATLLDEEYRDSLDEHGQQYLRFMIDSCHRMRDLIQGLLEYSRLGMRTQPETVNLNELLAEILGDLQSAIEASNAEISVPDLPTISVYRLELRLLFQNLIANALKFVAPGIQPRISVESNKADDAWQFAISDNGIGIAPEQRDKVFQIFQRLHARDEYGGTGIGLAHARKVVELHHGRIWIEEGPQGGARICFLIREMMSNE